MADQVSTRMAAVLDRLVADARTGRDLQFNTLDAVDRQARAAAASLQRRVERACSEHPARSRGESGVDRGQDVRTGRFEPEDDDDLPDTWLR
jgi:hypothetical protein